MKHACDFLVIGSGLAGLLSAGTPVKVVSPAPAP